MLSVINRGPYLDASIDGCCNGTSWLTSHLLFPGDDTPAGPDFLLLESGDYLLMEDGVSRFELE